MEEEDDGQILFNQPAGHKLDTGIVRAVWLDAGEIRASRERHRSPLVLRCVEDYLAGRRYPLAALVEHA